MHFLESAFLNKKKIRASQKRNIHFLIFAFWSERRFFILGLSDCCRDWPRAIENGSFIIEQHLHDLSSPVQKRRWKEDASIWETRVTTTTVRERGMRHFASVTDWRIFRGQRRTTTHFLRTMLGTLTSEKCAWPFECCRRLIVNLTGKTFYCTHIKQR